MIYGNVVFYNHSNANNLWLSREFVVEMIKKLPAFKFSYAHNCDKNIFIDLPTLDYMPLNEFCLDTERHVLVGDSLYINTHFFETSTITHYIEYAKDIYNDMLSKLGINFRLNKAVKTYLPTPDYGNISNSTFTNVNRFIYEHVFKTIILFNNDNIDYIENIHETINDIANRYTDCLFIITKDYYGRLENVFYIGDILEDHEINPFTISYLSQYVDITIGTENNSYVYTQTLYNFDNIDMYMYIMNPTFYSAYTEPQSAVQATLFDFHVSNNNQLYNSIKQVIDTVIYDRKLL